MAKPYSASALEPDSRRWTIADWFAAAVFVAVNLLMSVGLADMVGGYGAIVATPVAAASGAGPVAGGWQATATACAAVLRPS